MFRTINFKRNVVIQYSDNNYLIFVEYVNVLENKILAIFLDSTYRGSIHYEWRSITFPIHCSVHNCEKPTFEMAKSTTKVAAIAKATKTKPPSPKKAKKAPNMREKLKEKQVPTISVLGFIDPLSIEKYEYTLNATKDGFTNNFKLWAQGKLDVEELTAANFIGVKFQRNDEVQGNETLMSMTGYPRVWMIRYPPEGESTPETRDEGLRVLKTFFMSKKGSMYPEKNLEIVDKTSDVPAVLEKYFLDADIEEIIKASFDFSELDDGFYEKYTEFAESIYSEKEPSDFAKTILGFPSLEKE